MNANESSPNAGNGFSTDCADLKANGDPSTVRKYWKLVLARIAVGLDDMQQLLEYDRKSRAAADAALGVDVNQQPDDGEERIVIADDINHYHRETPRPSPRPNRLGLAAGLLGLTLGASSAGGLVGYALSSIGASTPPPPAANLDDADTRYGIELIEPD